MPYDPTTPAGRVRLLISDTADEPIFEDEEIDAFLDLTGSSVYRAAATALRAIAGNEAQVLKRIRLLDLDTDGAVVSEALRKLAADYDAEAARGDSGFEVAEIAMPPFGPRTQRHNRILRGQW